MRSDKLQDAMGLVSEEFIEDAHDESTYVNQNNTERGGSTQMKHWKQFGLVAACLCLVAAGTLGLIRHKEAPEWETPDGNCSPPISQTNNQESASPVGITTPVSAVSLKKHGDGIAADMLAFFIYNGKCYTETKQVFPGKADTLVGDYVGTATGLIDEWTPSDGYVELAGSIGGDFYSVNGYDPDFMLCMKRDDGSVQIFVASSGITLTKGGDLYEDRLHLSENAASLTYEDRDSWYYGEKDIQPIEDKDTISSLIAALDEADFLLADFDGGAPFTVQKTDNPSMFVKDEGQYRLTFETADGIPVGLWLMDDGYVFYDGLRSACVQLSPEAYQSILAACER